MNEEKIASIIVTCNRKLIVNECIQSLLKQTKPIDKIFLIDNASSDGTVDFLKKRYISPKIEIIPLKENIGSAGGFYIGIKRAFEEGFNWIWLMDDDAKASPNALSELIKYFYLKEEGFLAFASLIIDNNKPISNRGKLDLDNFWPLPFKPIKIDSYKNHEYIEIDFAAFIGFLLSRVLIQSVGLPNPNFFIYGDDVEYCIRIKKYGKICLIPKSIIYHNDSNQENFRKILWKKYQIIPMENFWRYYYGYRNLIYMGKLYSKNKQKYYLGLFIQFLKLLIGILLFDDYKFKRLKIIFLSFINGFRGNFRKYYLKF